MLFAGVDGRFESDRRESRVGRTGVDCDAARWIWFGIDDNGAELFCDPL